MARSPSYFDVYGGFNSVFRSKYFFGAIAMTIVLGRYFTSAGWWDLSVAVIPGLVGFSIAGVAIFISLGSDKLREVIAGRRKGSTVPSPFLKFMAMFTHFIVIQLMALVFALGAKAFYEAAPWEANFMAPMTYAIREPFWLVGGLFFSYAVLLCVALAIEIFRLAWMIDEHQSVENELPRAPEASKQVCNYDPNDKRRG